MDERKVSKARCQWIRALSSNTLRVKMEASSICRSPHARSLGAFRPHVRSTAQDKRSVVCSSWLFTRSSIQVQAWPVHQTRPNQSVGLRRLGPCPRRHRQPKPLLHKVDRSTRRAGGLFHCQNGRLGALFTKDDRHSGSVTPSADPHCLSGARSPQSRLQFSLLLPFGARRFSWLRKFLLLPMRRSYCGSCRSSYC